MVKFILYRIRCDFLLKGDFLRQTFSYQSGGITNEHQTLTCILFIPIYQDLKCCDRGCSVCGPICMSPEDDSHGPGNICFLPKNPQGSRVCYGYFPRWWYNWHTNECERFIYGGCNGNANNFETRQECERRCKRRYLPGGR